MSWSWQNGELVKLVTFCRIGKVYPKKCENTVRVCDPDATSFGDECRVDGCNKISC